MPPPHELRISRLAGLTLLLATLGGALAGVVRAWPWIRGGYAWVLPDLLAESLLEALPLAAVFVVLREVVFRVRRRAENGGERRDELIACAVAIVPLALYGGFQANVAALISPSALASPESLRINGVAATTIIASWLAVSFALAKTRGSGAAGQPRVIGVTGLLLVVGCVTPLIATAARDRPPVIVVLIDALRADHVGCYGYERDTTPHLDALAEDGIVFETAIAQSTFTKASIASLFTGRYPHHHGVYRGSLSDQRGRISSDVLRAEERTLAEAFSEHGYVTSAFIQNAQLRGAHNFDQGFGMFVESAGSCVRIHRRFDPFAKRFERTPFFSYLHYLDLHDPYRPIPPWDTKFGTFGDVSELDTKNWAGTLEDIRDGKLVPSAETVAQWKALYDGQIAFIDAQMGDMLDRLRESGIYDRAVIIVTADHGDGFMEHGFLSHSTVPYEELIRVPLVVKLPESRLAGTRVTTPVELMDVYPTVLEIVEAEPTEGIDAAALPGLGLPDRVRERDYTISQFHSRHGPFSLAIRREDEKYLRLGDGSEEFYDLSRDPGETTNLLPGAEPRLERFREIAALVDERRARLKTKQVELDAETVDELRGLGYVR